MAEKIMNSHTEKEIEGQPELWLDVWKLLCDKKQELNTFLVPLLKKKNVQIILTGAGSSAFIGEAAAGLVQKNTRRHTQAIPTTDLVTNPELLFYPKGPKLLVSFARSGNSPESLETVKLADNFCDEVYHLIITCNGSGDLLKYSKTNRKKTYALVLPERANDKSLAMTGSFTSMLLSILLISNLERVEHREFEVDLIRTQGYLILEKAPLLKKIAKMYFERVVFLGSGPMLGIARECHLKLQELTDGQVICKHDSFLGFRHGPRAVTTKDTLLVYLFSPDNFIYQYELDLALSIAKDSRKLKCLSVGRRENKALNSCLNIDLNLDPQQELNIIPTVIIGQILGYYKSLDRNLNPDNPSISGSISRVVQGVEIYDHPLKNIK